METPALRPRVALLAALTPAEAMDRMRAALDGASCPCQGAAAARHIELWICDAERHFWSPRLELSVTEHAGGARLAGRLGPHPDVWSLFLAGYAVSVFLGIAGAVVGLSQLTLDETPTALLGLPVSAGLIALLYAGATLGQRLGAGQIGTLHRFLTEALRVDLADELHPTGDGAR